jgi:hypothetical protein
VRVRRVLIVSMRRLRADSLYTMQLKHAMQGMTCGNCIFFYFID